MRRRELLYFALPFLGLLAIGWGALGKLSFPAVGQPTNSLPVGEIYGTVEIGQTVLSPYPGLYRIDVLLATYGRRNTQDVTFHLKESPSSAEDLVSITFNASELVEDNKFRSFIFSPIADSARKGYYFSFTSPSSTPEDAITIWARNDEAYAEGMKFANGAPAQGDLTFMTYYNPGLIERADFLLTQLTEKKPSIWGSKVFYIGLLLAYVALFSAFLAQVIRLGFEEKS